MESKKKVKVAGGVIVGFIALMLLLLGILHWLDYGFVLRDHINYLGYILLITLCLVTTVHLWTRVTGFEPGTSIRNLFTLMGISFIIIGTIFVYYIVDYLLQWAGFNSLSVIMQSAGLDLDFYLFGFVDISMPFESVVTFAFIMLGVSFFIYPLEKYVKNRRPWFAISLWLCLSIIPLIAVFKNNQLALSIATAGIVLFVLINFIFMFYLYIALAVKSTGRMRKASVLVAFGLFMMIFVWVVGIGLFDDKLVQAAVQFGIGIGSMTMFNIGFYIMG